VQSGSYQAGALSQPVWDVAVKNGKVSPNKVKVIWTTPAFGNYHWVARPNLDQRFGKGFTSKLQQSILGLTPTSKRQKTILELFAAKRFIPAQESQYQPIEQVGRQLGKIR
jgi:phosphonate transport system substrate-binding protein